MSQYANTSGSTGAQGGTFGPVLGIALLVNVAGLYFFPGVAVLTLGFIGVTYLFAARALASEASSDAGKALLIFSWIGALATGITTGAFHLWDFRWPALVTVALYLLAVLAFVMGGGQRLWPMVPALLLAGMLVCAVLMLPPPPGSLDEEKEDNWTHVTIRVVDQDDQPVEGAKVLVSARWFFQGDPPEDELGFYGVVKTDSSATAHTLIKEDTRLKTVVARLVPPAGTVVEPSRQEKFITGEHESVVFEFRLKRR